MAGERQSDREKSRKTRERILVAAERHFAAKGFAGASMRSIMAEAKVNLSVAYYYFKDKEALLVAVLERYVVPVVTQERELLKKAREEAGDAPIPLRKLIEISLLRLTSTCDEKDSVRQLFLLLFARVGTFEQRIYARLDGLLKEPRALFEKEFLKTCPQLSLEELRFRLAMLDVLLNGWKAVGPFLKETKAGATTIPMGTYREWLIESTTRCFLMPPVRTDFPDKKISSKEQKRKK